MLKISEAVLKTQAAMLNKAGQVEARSITELFSDSMKLSPHIPRGMALPIGFPDPSLGLERRFLLQIASK